MTKKTKLVKKYPITFPVTFAELKLLKKAAKGWGVSPERFAKIMTMASAGGEGLPQSHPVASCPWTRFKELVEKDPPKEMLTFEYRPQVGEKQGWHAVRGIENCSCGHEERLHTGLGGNTNHTSCLNQGCPCEKYRPASEKKSAVGTMGAIMAKAQKCRENRKVCLHPGCKDTRVGSSFHCLTHRTEAEKEYCAGCGHGSKKHALPGPCPVKGCGCKYFDDERK